ncbi:MAG: hypothetical protein IPN95_25990 [Bacteroidetes bacterium]|nr:hypothetical protein [Bacteroidota bacterium]
MKNAQELQNINGRISTIEKDLLTTRSRLDDNFTIPLLDEFWILEGFEPVLDEYILKVENAYNLRRKIQSEFDREKGVREGQRMAHLELLNNAVPLPLTVPSKVHMEEMLQEEICKVCNREAKKGTDAYNFMYRRLQEYFKSHLPIQDDEEVGSSF